MSENDAEVPVARAGSNPGSFIQVKNVWQQYGDQVVLERLNLNIAEGEFCTLVGASGCGKSTFLRLLLGQEAPSRPPPPAFHHGFPTFCGPSPPPP